MDVGVRMKARILLGVSAIALLIGPQIACAQTYATGKNGQGFTGTVNQTTSTNLSGVYPAATPSLAPGQQQQLTVDPSGNLNVHVQLGAPNNPAPVYPANGASPFPISASSPLPINGTVNVGNYPSIQSVSASAPFPVTGTLNVGNFPTSTTVTNLPSTYPISVASAIPVNCVAGCPTNSGGSSGAVYPAAGASPFPVTGSFYQSTQPVSVATTLPVREQGTVPVTGTFFQATQPVSIATTIPVSIVSGGSGSSGAVYPAVGSSPFPVNGTVNVGNFPATQPVSIATTIPVSVVNGGTGGGPVYPAPSTSPFPVSGSVSVGNFPSTQAVSGTVNVGNLPANQAVSGSVSVSNLPATQPVSVATTLPVSVSNFPASQTVTGSVGVSNFPATQNVSIIASTPLPIQPVTLNVPSPLPIYAPSPLPIIPGATNTTYYAGATSAGNIVKGSTGMLFGIINTSTTAQAPTMTCYNNATTASGNVLWSGTLQASQVVTFGNYGITASNGIFCQPSAATNSGNGINFMWL